MPTVVAFGNQLRNNFLANENIVAAQLKILLIDVFMLRSVIATNIQRDIADIAMIHHGIHEFVFEVDYDLQLRLFLNSQYKVQFVIYDVTELGWMVPRNLYAVANNIAWVELPSSDFIVLAGSIDIGFAHQPTVVQLLDILFVRG